MWDSLCESMASVHLWAAIFEKYWNCIVICLRCSNEPECFREIFCKDEADTICVERHYYYLKEVRVTLLFNIFFIPNNQDLVE